MRFWCLPALLSFALPAFSAAEDLPERVRFNRHVRPILADKCFACHGPDENARQSEVRLDTRAGLFTKVGPRTPVVPGKPGESELYARITHDDPDVRMPPRDATKQLTDRDIRILERWIEQGAPWEGHWAFVPPKRPKLPDVDRRGWARNAIDRFVLARLERVGLAPNEAASKETLIRRVTLDLTGLPPTLEEVDRFLADERPDAYERLVDRLLASPRYGEHMAVPWLDAARYADTSGYQNDGPRHMWAWRDWVIDAYNANKPFDEFTVEQLAGDLLADGKVTPDTLDLHVATGFNRNHRGNAEGGIVPEEFAVEYVVDRVDTTATVWMGLTMGCARCHDHKFDPVSQREFYRLFDYFNDVPENGRAIKVGNSPPYVKVPSDEQQQRLESFDRRIARAERRVANWPDRERMYEEWERSLKDAPRTAWTITDDLAARFELDVPEKWSAPQAEDESADGPRKLARGRQPESVPAPTGRGMRFDRDGFLDAGDVGKFGYFDEFTVSAWVRPEADRTGGIVTRMTDDSDSDGWAMHLENGRVQALFVRRWLDDALRLETKEPLQANAWQHVTVVYDGSRTAEGVEIYVDGMRQEKVVRLDALNQTFANDAPLRIGSTGTERKLTGSVADVRIYDRALPAGEVAVVAALPGSVNELAAVPEAKRTPAQREALRQYWLREAAPEKLRNVFANLVRWREERTEFYESLPTVMVMASTAEPRPSHVLKRGAYDKPGERVTAGVPEILARSTSADAGDDRLDFARWLVDPNHPLTARVAVNRYWQRIFGTGIVKTAEDFGTQGERPSHPDLLDWLATEFVRTGWDVKRMQRLIVTSATYRQSSTATRELLEKDPENRLLARGPRFRLRAETVRDQALAVSGLLTEHLGGPSVKPYQPPGLWEAIATTSHYERDSGPDLYRRSLYTYWKRTVANPTMTAFDATTREACTLRRSRTNTPLQALALMNDVTFVEAARVLAERALREGGEAPEDRVTWAFRRVTSRHPSEQELAVLTSALESHLAHYRERPEAAKALVETGESAPDPSLDASELAAYSAVSSLILNLDEAVTKE